MKVLTIMELGGVLLGAGMMLQIQPGDYMCGDVMIRFTVLRIVEVCRDPGGSWVVLEGDVKHPNGPWYRQRITVRVKALKKSLIAAA